MVPTCRPRKSIDAPHPAGVPAGQVIVYRDDVHAFAGEGIQVGGQDRDQGFTFTGFHFGDFALVEDDAADELDVEGSHTQGPEGSLPGYGEGLGEEVVQGLPPVQALLEVGGFGGEIRIGKLAHLRFEGGYLVHEGGHAAQIPVIFAAKGFFQNKVQHITLDISS